MGEFRLFPEQASTAAERVDALYAFLCSVTGFFTLLIFLLVVGFAIYYRRRNAIAPPHVHTNYPLEITWMAIPLVIVMVIFFWGAKVYFFMNRPPKEAIEVYVVGKQWMWKIQHPNGKREINELHVPINAPIKLTMSSQDVVHSFFLPNMRVKQDVVPGRYTVLWFEATKTGESHLFCAEYCGAQHSGMIGRVVVMEPDQYQAWLTSTPIEETPAEAGSKLFTQLGCITCHGVQAPTLAGLYMKEQKLADGRTVVADDQYLRDSILNSTKDIVAGYAPIMPSFRNQLSEEQLIQLIAYIKSLDNPAQQQRGR